MGEGTGGRRLRLRPRGRASGSERGGQLGLVPLPSFPSPAFAEAASRRQAPGEEKLILERIIKNPPSPPFAKGGWGGLYFQMKI